MSYVRQSHCDLYVYEDIDFGLTCCNCLLRIDGRIWFYGGTHEKMLEHLKLHEAAGHDLGGVVEMLRDELAEIAATTEVPACPNPAVPVRTDDEPPGSTAPGGSCPDGAVAP